MLDVLRASKGGLVTWIFLAAIIVVFVISFGPGSFARGNRGCGAAPIYAAVVDGETVPALLYERQLQQLSAYYRAQYGDELLRMLGPQLGQQAMESVVSRALLVQDARRRGLEVSREDISKAVWSSPSFQDEKGNFKKDIYTQATLQEYGSTKQYEDLVRTELLLQRLQAAFESTVKVPEAEVHSTWKRISDRVDLSYVLFPEAEARAEVKLSDADLQAFATKEGARIAKYYQDNPARFDQPARVHARHILARVEGKDDAAARKKIDGAAARLEKGEDFAKVAADLSEDVNTAKSGGDLGVITAAQVDPALAQAALALKAGASSKPVRTGAGWEIVRADEILPAKKLELEAARPEIARELLSGDRAAALVEEKAAAALQAARGGKALDELYPQPRPAQPAAEGKPAVPEQKAALSLGGRPVVARDTGPFPASVTLVPGLNFGGDLLKDAVAAAAPGVLARVYRIPAGVVVAVVKERKRPDESAYPKEREGLEGQLRAQKAQQLRQEWVADLRARAKVVENTLLIPRPATPDQAPEPPQG